MITFIPTLVWPIFYLNVTLIIASILIFFYLWFQYKDQEKKYRQFHALVLFFALSLFCAMPLFRVLAFTIFFWIAILVWLTMLVFSYVKGEEIYKTLNDPNHNKGIRNFFVIFALVIAVLGTLAWFYTMVSENPSVFIVSSVMFIFSLFFHFVTFPMKTNPEKKPQ